jgi:hypothetical protein
MIVKLINSFLLIFMEIQISINLTIFNYFGV